MHSLQTQTFNGNLSNIHHINLKLQHTFSVFFSPHRLHRHKVTFSHREGGNKEKIKHTTRHGIHIKSDSKRKLRKKVQILIALDISPCFLKELRLIENDEKADAINVLVMAIRGTHSYLLLPLTLAQSHRFFSTLAGICLLEKKRTNSPFHTSFILLSRSLTLTRSNTNPTH